MSVVPNSKSSGSDSVENQTDNTEILVDLGRLCGQISTIAIFPKPGIMVSECKIRKISEDYLEFRTKI